MKLLALTGIIFSFCCLYLATGILDLKTLITGILAGAFGAMWR